MTFNFNFDPSLIKRAVIALEQLAHAYAIVHAHELEAAELAKGVADKGVGRVFYQSDAELYRAEQEEKVRASMEL
jgi:hypothetical protein